jgi:protein-S-isoprenylcysteine O-methyltransferase Ste14
MPNFQSLGGFFFRFRGQLPLVFLVILIPLSFWIKYPLYPADSMLIIRVISSLLIFLGIAIRALVIAQKAPHTSGRNRHEQVAHSLNTSGLYSVTQHPLYMGSFLIWIGICIRFNNVFFIAGILLFSVLMLYIIIKAEAEFLRNKFGEAYDNWSRATPAFYVNPLRFKASNSPMNGIRVLATEYPTWVSILAGLLMIDIIQFFYFELDDVVLYRMAGWIIAALFVGFGGRFFKYVVVRRWLKRSI